MIAAVVVIMGLMATPNSLLAGQETAPMDIPGSLWVAGPVDSNVGAQIYDQVWRLELDSPRVIVARIVGESGSELGLYLFGPNATSVSLDTPIVSSSRPGGSQSVIASVQAGTYFVNVNGRNSERPYRFSLSINLFEDLTAPVMRPYLLPGSGVTSQDHVDIALQAVDLLSGVVSVRHRIENTDWSDWIPYKAVIRLDAPLEEGEHRLQLQVKNGVNLNSAVATLVFSVDRTLPKFSLLTAPEFGISTAKLPLISLAFNEPMYGRSLTRAFNLTDRFGAVVPLRRQYDVAKRVVTMRPIQELTVGMNYALSIAGAADIAGNELVATDVVSFKVVNPSAIKIGPRAMASVYGKTVRFSASTIGIDQSSNILLEFKRRDGVDWLQVGSVVVDGSSLRVEHLSTVSGLLRLRYVGDETTSPALSRPLPVNVSHDITFSRLNLTRIADGDEVAFRASVSPLAETARVVVRKCNKLFLSCARVATMSVQRSVEGLFDFRWDADAGYWSFKLIVPGTDVINKGVSANVEFRVFSKP